MIKCICNQIITGVHYEEATPSAFNSGSKSFVAVATPCNHAIGALPMTWESLLRTSIKEIEGAGKKIVNLQYSVETIAREIQGLKKCK